MDAIRGEPMIRQASTGSYWTLVPLGLAAELGAANFDGPFREKGARAALAVSNLQRPRHGRTWPGHPRLPSYANVS